MNEQAPESDVNENPLVRVHEGMKVYDQQGKEIGKVKQVYFGASPTGEEEGKGPATPPVAPAPAQSPAPLLSDLAKAAGGEEKIPGVLRRRLELEGFIRIDAGLLSADRFATPSQVASVSGDRVQLNVPADKLIAS